jgi:hypothetical protein
LLSLKMIEISQNYNKINLFELSQILAIDPQNLIEVVNLLIKQQKSPIKSYIPKTQEFIFNRS